MSFIIRKANENDAKAVADLLVSVGEVHWRGRSDIYQAHMKKHDECSARALILGGEYGVLVAEENGVVIGELIYKITAREADAFYKARKWLYIDDLCVCEEARGSGVAVALQEEAERIAREEGCDALELNCWAFNTRAEKFYEKMGYVRQKSEYEKIL